MKTPLLDGIKKSAALCTPVEDLPNVGDKVLSVDMEDPKTVGDHIFTISFNSGRKTVGHYWDEETRVKNTGGSAEGGVEKKSGFFLLDGISKKAKKQHVRPLRGTGKTTGMFRRINNLQQGIHYGKKEKKEEFPHRLSIYEGITKRANVERLKKKYGITKTERVKSGGYMHTIGFSPKNQKFYGWSHRAVYGFGIGSKVKKGDSGFIPSNKDEFMKSLKKWYSKKVELTEVPGGVKVNEGEYSHIEHYPKPWGKGEYIAKTLEDAKQMAADFAESVS